MTCPFCGRDPFHYVDNGVGMEAVAVPRTPLPFGRNSKWKRKISGEVVPR